MASLQKQPSPEPDSPALIVHEPGRRDPTEVPAVARPARDAVGRAHDPRAATRLLIDRLGHDFHDPTLLETALTHPSWRNEQGAGMADNQRLEFLGDAVLGLVVTHELVARLPDRREGELTVLKSQLVRERTLAALAERLLIGPALRLGKGEDQTGGRQRPSVLADALEAVLGALLLDAGYEATRAVVLELFHHPLMELLAKVESVHLVATPLCATTANWKTAAQELLQRMGSRPPTYTLVAEDGPVHARRFRVQAVTQVKNQPLCSMGEGPSKKVAENQAAATLYESLLEQASALRGADDPARPEDGDKAAPR